MFGSRQGLKVTVQRGQVRMLRLRFEPAIQISVRLMLCDYQVAYVSKKIIRIINSRMSE
jgi:hypothetical protein